MASTDSTNIAPYTKRVGALHYTEDATQVTALTIPTRPDHAYFVEVRVTAKENVDSDEIATYWRQAAFKNDGGTLSLVGSVRTVVTDNESTAGWDVTLDANSTNIRVRITGAASTDLTWLIIPTVYECGTASARNSDDELELTGWING